jgi:hypothetical protein
MKIRFRHIAYGEVVETDVYVGLASRWKERPESSNPAWGARRIGPRLILAVCCPVSAAFAPIDIDGL